MKLSLPLRGRFQALVATAFVLLACCLAPAQSQTVNAPPVQPCRTPGVETGVLCGSVKRPLNEAAPNGKQIDIHFVVLPALARNKAADPVFLFAGGPGQSAIKLAGSAHALFARLKNRRDIVLIDQRGVGKSMGLDCKTDPKLPMDEANNMAALPKRMLACRAELRKKHGLTDEHFIHFTTAEASRDVDAVRQSLGYGQINAVGGSYGTRAVLDYMRQFPQHVRRSILDGVAPPDMVLPSTVSGDSQAALDALLDDCEGDAQCKKHYPRLRDQWKALLASLPRQVTTTHPVTLQIESVTITADTVAAAVRGPLYSPWVASALPLAIVQAAKGRFGSLLGLANAGGAGSDLAWGMHFSVLCAEDFPRVATSKEQPGIDMGLAFSELYTQVCTAWPQAPVAAAFYTTPPAQSPVLMLSGALDPVTPPRHANRTAQALGVKVKHVVAPKLGHGVMSQGCTPSVMYRFLNAASEAEAMATDTSCIVGAPRPQSYVLPGASND